jgi:hypothetical protein
MCTTVRRLAHEYPRASRPCRQASEHVKSGTCILPVGFGGIGILPMIHGLEAHATLRPVCPHVRRSPQRRILRLGDPCPAWLADGFAHPPSARPAQSLRPCRCHPSPWTSPRPRLLTHPLRPWRCHPNREILKWNRHDSSSLFFRAILTSSGFPPAPGGGGSGCVLAPARLGNNNREIAAGRLHAVLSCCIIGTLRYSPRSEGAQLGRGSRRCGCG